MAMKSPPYYPKVTKLEAANRQLREAIRMFFSDGDSVCVHTLASSAREIYERHCEKEGVERMFDLIRNSNPSWIERDIWHLLNEARNFFKHVGTSLDECIEFDDAINDCTLLIASYDCAMLRRDQAIPEAGIFLTWISITHEALSVPGEPRDEADQQLRWFDEKWPGLRTADREEKKRFGRFLMIENRL